MVLPIWFTLVSTTGDPDYAPAFGLVTGSARPPAIPEYTYYISPEQDTYYVPPEVDTKYSSR